VIRSSENLDRIIAFLPRVSSVALLLTLARHTEEGHLAYRSGVNTLAKGPLREDGPRRKHTGNAPARAQTRRSDWRERRLPRLRTGLPRYLLHRPAHGGRHVWQVTACDAASSFGIARILPALSPTATARLLRDVVVPTARRAGWRVQRVLKDRGNEFKRSSRPPVRRLGFARPHRNTACLDERLRRAPAADNPQRALTRPLPPLLFHASCNAEAQPARLLTVLQLLQAPSRLPCPGTNAASTFFGAVGAAN
jgi:hypothetical protein